MIYYYIEYKISNDIYRIHLHYNDLNTIRDDISTKRCEQFDVTRTY